MDDLDGLEIRHLRYFLKVAQTGKISAASQELNVAQPSLSLIIKRLERRIGITLFARTARGVELTAGGRIFQRGVERIMDELAGALADAGSTVREVRIGMPAGVDAALLGEIDDAIARHHECGVLSAQGPRSVVYHPADSARQLDMLRSGELDFAVVRLPIDDQDMTTVTISDQELGIVVHVQHPLSRSSQVTWYNLRDQRLLWFDTRRAPGYARELLAWLDEHGWRPRLHVDDSDRHTLFTYLLGSAADLVALRPYSAVHADPLLAWRPIADGAPRERLGLAAVRAGAETIRRIAASRHAFTMVPQPSSEPAQPSSDPSQPSFDPSQAGRLPA